MPEAFKLLAGGKRGATTGKSPSGCLYPGGMTAGIPPGYTVCLEQIRWWRFAYHRLIAAIPPGCVLKQLKLNQPVVT
jgi:hypothetical protein